MKAALARFIIALLSVVAPMGAEMLPGHSDSSFDVGAGFNGDVKALAVQADGKLLVGGNFTSFNGLPAPRIARLLPSGELDPSFQPASGPNLEVRFIFTASEGKVLIGGTFTSFNEVPRRLVARLNSDGTLDETYALELPSSQLTAAEMQPDGKLLIGGTFASVNGQPYRYFARLNQDGTLDESFGPFNAISSAWPHALKLQPDGRILVSMSSYSKDGLSRDFLFRLNSDGSLDESFDSHRVIFASSVIELLPDGSLIGRWMGLKRLFPDGTYDSLFAMPDPFPNEARSLSDGRILAHLDWRQPAIFYSDGSLQYDLSATLDDGVNAIAPGPNGTLYVGGDFRTVDGFPQQGIARIFIDNFSAPATVEWNGRNFAALEAKEAALLPLIRSGDTNAAISVHVSSEPLEATEEDFSPTEFVVDFAPGEKLKYASLPLVNDELPERDESLRVTLTALDESFSDSATVTIISDEGILRIASPHQSASELSPSPSFSVEKVGAVPYSITAELAFQEGTITYNADALWTSLPIVVGEGQNSRVVTISLMDDQVAEEPEYMVLELKDPDGPHVREGNFTFRLDLTDNDRPGVPGEGFNVAPRLIHGEDGGLLAFGSFSSIHGLRLYGPARLDSAGQTQGRFPGIFPQGGPFSPEPFGVTPLQGLDDGKSFYQIIYTNRYVSSSGARTGFYRLNSDGTRDTSYDTNLTFAYPIAFDINEHARIVMAQSTNLMGRASYALRVIGTNGLVERSIVGRIYPSSASTAPVLAAQQSTGHILIAGYLYGLTNAIQFPQEHQGYAKNLLRFNPDGTPDLTFHHGVESSGRWTVHLLKVLPDDRILLAGDLISVDGAPRRPLARLLPNGALDAAFNPDFSSLGSEPFQFSEILPQADGKLVLRVKTADGTDHLVRLTETGQLDNTFPQRAFEPDALLSIVQMADGRIALSGEFLEIGDQPRGRIAYLSSEGELLHDQPLELLNLTRSEGTLKIELASRIAGEASVQASDDLRSWITLESFPILAGEHHLELSATEHSYAFFRVVMGEYSR